jgi:hypothetical protein
LKAALLQKAKFGCEHDACHAVEREQAQQIRRYGSNAINRIFAEHAKKLIDCVRVDAIASSTHQTNK